MTSGVMMAPTVLAAFMMPRAMDRWSLRKMAAMVLMAVGVPRASVAPRAKRATVNWPTVRAKAWAMAALLQAPTASRRVGAPAPADPVHQPAGAQERDGGGELEHRGQLAVVGVGPVQVLLQHRLEHGDDLAVGVVQHAAEEQHAQDQPVAGGPHG